MKSRLGKEIISKVLEERRQERIFYQEYEDKRKLKEDVERLNQRLNRIDTQVDNLSDTMEKESIPQDMDVSLTKEYGEYVFTKKKVVL